jgi:hypothetical protein
MPEFEIFLNLLDFKFMLPERIDCATACLSSASFAIASKISQFVLSIVASNCEALLKHSPMAASVVATAADASDDTT